MRFSVSVLCCVLCAVSLYPRGKAESLPSALNTEYVFCITAFDVSGLPPSQRAFGAILQNRFARALRGIDSRIRSPEEIERYTQAAWSEACREAAVKLAAKRMERDELFYRGFPDWKYKKERKRIDREINDLETKFTEAENVRPLIEEHPVFRLEDSFPEAPAPGEEDAFFERHGADAFLAGTISSYYGRIYAELKLHTKNSAVVYADEAVFFPEDMNAASEEMARRVQDAVYGKNRSALAVYAGPENARILVNGTYAANGEPVNLNPGPVSVSVSSEGFETFTGTLELAPGERALSNIVLDPVSMELLKLAVPGYAARIYQGALFIGFFPPETGAFELSVPKDHYRYISAETEDGRTGRVIVEGGKEPRRNGGRPMTLETRLPGLDEKPVEKRRREFYGAWGRLWVTAPLAFLLNGVALSYAKGYNEYPGSRKLHDGAETSMYIANGALVTAGIFAAESLVRLVIYINTANREAVPLWE